MVILLLHQRLEVHHGMEFLWCVAKEGLQVADEPVDVALARRLVDDVLVIVIAQATAKLLVVHLRFVLPHAPSSSHLAKMYITTAKQITGLFGNFPQHNRLEF